MKDTVELLEIILAILKKLQKKIEAEKYVESVHYIFGILKKKNFTSKDCEKIKKRLWELTQEANLKIEEQSFLSKIQRLCD